MSEIRKQEKDADSNSPQKATSTMLSRFLGAFPPWITTNLRSAHSWKLLARSWVTAWVSLVVILPNKSLTALGNTAFFALLGSLMVPPSMPVQMFIFVVSLLLIGQLLGWALGAASMKAATSARNQILLRSAYQAAQQTAATAVNPDDAFRLEVFQGAFLDIRSSAVYGTMLAVFSFIFALARAYRPQLILLVTFAQIVLDILCTFGPLFPNTQYEIVSSVLISTSVYLAIGILSCIFIFPETMNHSYLAAVDVLLGQLKSYGGLYDSVLELSPEDLTDDPTGIVDRCEKQRLGLIFSMQGLQQKGGLINVEFSFGRWNGSDARALEEPLRIVVARMTSFYSYPRLIVATSFHSLTRSSTKSEEGQGGPASSILSAEEVVGDTELIRQLVSRRYAHETENNVRMSDILPELRASTAELRAACTNALGSAQGLIRQINSGRWTRGSNVINEKELELNKALARLRKSADFYRSRDRLAIVEPFLPILRAADEDHQLRKQLTLRSLIIASSFAAQIVVTADGIIELLDLIQKTTNKRQKARLWAPSGLRALGNFIIRREKDTALDLALGENTVIELDDEEREEESPFRRDPDSRPPTNVFQKIMNSLHVVYKWGKSPEAMFAAKSAILSVLLWLPAVFQSSAHLYYVEKGVWALIMAQTSINVFVSDTIYSLVTRTLGTCLGLVVGLVIWYIGNGSGNGNPYGIAAAYGVFIIPVLFVRINAPPALLLPLIMFNATLALVVGYSWIDAKLNVVGNPGVGWPIAWRRFVLVMIGIAAAAIFMILPPVSGRKAVRLQNSALIKELSSVYSSLMSVWITEEESDARTDEVRNDEHGGSNGDDNEVGVEKSIPPSVATTVKPGWASPLRKRLFSLVEQIQTVQVQTAMAKLEGNIRGAWPAQEYAKLLEKESDMLAALGQLSLALQRLDPSWKASLNRRTMILNPNFITDVMSIFVLVSQSLRTGEPMHQILPTSLLDRLLYHHTHDILSRKDQGRLENVSYVERASSFDFIFFASGVTAVTQIIQSLDEMHRITRNLCGEVPFRGFSEWKNDYDRVFRSESE